MRSTNQAAARGETELEQKLRSRSGMHAQVGLGSGGAGCGAARRSVGSARRHDLQPAVLRGLSTGAADMRVFGEGMQSPSVAQQVG